MADKKLSELPLTSAINAEDISLLVSDGTDYKFAFTSLLQFIGDNLNISAKVSFGTVLPSNTSGKNGDLFIKTDTGAFAQKISGVWTIVYTIPSSSGTTNGTILYGIGIPGGAIGNDNYTYINTGTGVFYKKASGTWSQVFSMQTGPQGPQGLAGTNGTNGTNGFSVLSGATTPSNSGTGVNGDFYINTSTYTLYGPKTGGVWGDGVSLLGNGIPNGGTTGQVLVKSSNDDLDADWGDIGVSYGNITGNVADSASLSAALSGKADLVSGKVPSGQLPGYVDDVLEYANIASLPATGEAGKIYVTLNDNCEYRWSGSTYVQIVASPGSTDAVPEGSTNKYFTAARVLASILTSIGFGTATAVLATDSILTAFGKIQAQITALFKIPAGGTAGQILAKVDSADGNTSWIDAPSGGGVSGLTSKKILFGKSDGTIEQDASLEYDKTTHSLYLGDVQVYVTPTGNIVFVGDSITTGQTATPSTNGFSYILSSLLGLSQINNGASGTTLGYPGGGYGASSLKNNLTRIKTKTADDKYLIIEYGANDIAHAQGTAYTADDFGDDYRTCLDYALAHGWAANEIVVLTLPWINKYGQLLSPSDYMVFFSAFNAEIAGLADDYPGLQIFDFYGLFLSNGGISLTTDGLHPGNFGHWLLGTAIYDVLRSDTYQSGQDFAVNGVIEARDIKLTNYQFIDDNGGYLVGRRPDGSFGTMLALPANTRSAGDFMPNGGIKQVGAIKPDLGAFPGGALGPFDSLYNAIAKIISVYSNGNNVIPGFYAFLQLLDGGGNSVFTNSMGATIFCGGANADQFLLKISQSKKIDVYGDININNGNNALRSDQGTGYYGGMRPLLNTARTVIFNQLQFGKILFATSGGVNGAEVDTLQINADGSIEGLINGQALIMKSPDGTKYKLSAPNGGGAATWVAV